MLLMTYRRHVMPRRGGGGRANLVKLVKLVKFCLFSMTYLFALVKSLVKFPALLLAQQLYDFAVISTAPTIFAN